MTDTAEPQYDVLDENGHQTGEVLGRAEVHRRELWHEVVNVWILNHDGEVLLQLRSPEVELSPGVWDVAVGTHMRPGEDPVAAAARGLAGELGVTVLPESLKHLFNIKARNPMPNGSKHCVLGHVFLLKLDIDINTVTLDSSKISQLIWRPVVQVMAEIGGTDTASKYFPREGAYYPQIFDALLASAPPEMNK
ncbi:MAG TPA: NUDIX domain-containing protein [Candidatus Saccharimonadales bacterium]|nr:NUDIX domain-containing protein [Candidatus Saccharimonadales bacterium]